MRILNGLFTSFLLIQAGALLLSTVVSKCSCEDATIQESTEIPTVTVRGFLNFRTTVDGTVIVFTPASELPKAAANTKDISNPSDDQLSRNVIIDELTSKDAVPVDIQDLSYTQPPALPDPMQPMVSDYVTLGGPKIKEPYLNNHLTDNVVIPSSVQTDNDLETEVIKKSSHSQNHYPTGLVTVLNGVQVESGKTTLYETKVVGTYIDGKYAQILQSTSKIVAASSLYTPSYKTVGHSSEIKPSSTATNSPLFSKTSKNEDLSGKIEASTPKATMKSELNTLTPMQIPSISANFVNSRPFSSQTVDLQSSILMPEMTSKINVAAPTQSLDIIKTRMPIKLRSSHSIKSTPIRQHEDEDTLLSSKNLRMSSSRIRFTAPRRPSQRVRLNRFKVKLTLRQNATDGDITTPSEDDEQEDDDHTAELVHPHHEDALDLDIDPAHVVYKATTITSEVTLHVGRRKSIRTLTITTSVPMTINPTEAQDTVLNHDNGEHDHDVEENVPPTLSIITRTFTTTERTYTTTLVPVFDGTSTTNHMLTESFFIMKIVTAYRTLPPSGVTVVTTEEEQTEVPEILATTLDVAANVQPTAVELSQTSQTQQTLTASEPPIQPSVPMPGVHANMNSGVTDPLLSFGQALSNNPLAAVYLGLQQLNAQMTLYSTVTHTSTYVTTDTIYSTKTIRFYDGRTTRFRTTSDPISTKKRTITTTVTSMQPYINTQAYQQQQHLQKLIAATQMAAPQQQYSTLTSIYTSSATATSLSTRIYTLIYNGFSTKFRTVTSTKLYPTLLTVTSTKEVPIAATHPPLLPFAYPYPAA